MSRVRRDESRDKSGHNLRIRSEAALLQKTPTTPSFPCFSVETASGWAGGIPGRAGQSHVTDQSRGQRQASSFLCLYPFSLTVAHLICAWDRIIMFKICVWGRIIKIMLDLIILTQLFSSNNHETTTIIIITITTATGFFSVCEKMGGPKP